MGRGHPRQRVWWGQLACPGTCSPPLAITTGPSFRTRCIPSIRTPTVGQAVGEQPARGLIGGGQNPCTSLLAGQDRPPTGWPQEFANGRQRRFLDGLDALHRAGAFHEFEQGKREFIGSHTHDGLLMVQGPPGTGKSFSTAFALLARFQGAMACGRKFRVAVSCKTHAATDVLIENIAKAQDSWQPCSGPIPASRTPFRCPVARHRPLPFRGRVGIHHRVADVPRDRDRPTEAIPVAWHVSRQTVVRDRRHSRGAPWARQGPQGQGDVWAGTGSMPGAR